MSTLYLVATPIGNLEDITLRALRVLSEVAIIAAEDTRTARKLLTQHGLTARTLSYTEHNMKGRTPQLLSALAGGTNIALISEAGTPGISDPGFELIQSALAAGHEVSPVPGPAAPVAAVTASGLPCAQFAFLGFLPRRSTERRRLFRELSGLPFTLVAFESPHRLRASLADILTELGDRRIAVCRELTKLHEEIFRGTVGGAIARFESPRGEFTLVIDGASPGQLEMSDADLTALLTSAISAGKSARDAVTEVARETGMPRRRVYELSLHGQEDAESD